MDSVADYHQQIQVHCSNIAVYQAELEQLQIELSRLADITATLNQSAQEQRADLQGYGRGAASLVLGNKFTAARRKEAGYKRSRLAQEVAERKAQIHSAKVKINEQKRILKDAVASEKQAIRDLEVQLKAVQPISKKSKSVKSSNVVEQLARLAELHEQGLLTKEEFSAGKKRLLEGQ